MEQYIAARLLEVCGIQEGDEEYDDMSFVFCDNEVWYGLTLIIEDITKAPL